MKTPILGSSYVARSVNAADSRMVNLFAEIVPEGGKEAAFLQRAPGLRLLKTLNNAPVRGLWALQSDPTTAFAVAGNVVYKLDTSWNATVLGYVSGTGPVSMSDNGTQVFIACNGPSYIYNNSTGIFGQITDPDFPGAVTVGYLDGYFVFNEPNSQKVWVTQLLDGTNIDALDFASAEGAPDQIVSLIIDHREVWLFGSNSVEVWYDAGLTDFPLARIQGAFNELGCIAPYSVAKLDNRIFWLGADARGRGIVYVTNGYTGARVSTHAVEWQIQQYTDLSDAIGYTYQQDGHSFYVLIFPNADTTWVYDVSTQSWHERAGFQDGQFTRHRSNCQMSFNGEIVVGDYSTGKLYALDPDVYDDAGDSQKWLRSWRALPTGQNNLKRTAHHTLQLDCETGNGLTGLDEFEASGVLLMETGDALLTEDSYKIGLEFGSSTLVAAVDPKIMLRWSDDGGHTWSNEHWVSTGKIGQYGRRAIWRRLGMTTKLRDRVYEVSGTAPVKTYIMGAELFVSPTNA